MELMKGLYQLTGGMFAVHQNVYAVDAGTEIVLIDSGKDEKDYEVICRNLSYWGLSDKPVGKVLLTHAHVEHSGNAARFERGGAVIYGHTLCKEAVESGNDRTACYAFMHQPPFECCKGVIAVAEGDIISSGDLQFSVVETPGHSDDSVVYMVNLNGTTIMFSGDTILCDKLNKESRLGWTGAVDYDQNKYLQTLIRLSEFNIDTLLPGHGEICLKEAWRMLGGAYVRARLELVTKPSAGFTSKEMFR